LTENQANWKNNGVSDFVCSCEFKGMKFGVACRWQLQWQHLGAPPSGDCGSLLLAFASTKLHHIPAVLKILLDYLCFISTLRCIESQGRTRRRSHGRFQPHSAQPQTVISSRTSMIWLCKVP